MYSVQVWWCYASNTYRDWHLEYFLQTISLSTVKVKPNHEDAILCKSVSQSVSTSTKCVFQCQ